MHTLLNLIFQSFFYYVNDGAYGSLNNVMYDHADVTPLPLSDNVSDQKFTATLWGPTCDSMDCITRKAQLPELKLGDWLIFRVCIAFRNNLPSLTHRTGRWRVHHCCRVHVQRLPAPQDGLHLLL